MEQEGQRPAYTGITRRDFVKGTAIGLGALGLLGLQLGGKPVEAAAPPDKWDEVTDVVIIGSGFAGLAAAIEARRAGASVKVLEKMPIIGGNSRINGGVIAAVGTPFQKEQGIEDSVELYMQDMLKAGLGLNHPELARFLGKNTWPTVQWTMDDLGVEYSGGIVHMGGHSVPRSHATAEGSGWGIVEKELEAFEALGGRVETRRKLVGLVHDEAGVVMGVKILDRHDYRDSASGTVKYIRATKGVILASGGFSADVGMRMDQNPSLTADVETTNQPGATGEALREALLLGAAPIHLSWIQMGPWASPDETGFGIGPHFASDVAFPYGIMVDPKTGKRFINELADRRERAEAQLKVGKDPQYPIGLADAQGIEASTMADIWLDQWLERGVVRRFESIDELARYYGIPVQGLKAEIERYNGFVRAGVDEDWGKPLGPCKPIEQGPFFAMRFWPKVHHTMGGVKIDTFARVRDLENKVIPHLYAAGEIVGGIHGACRLGSVAAVDYLCFGRVAGAVAAGAPSPYAG